MLPLVFFCIALLYSTVGFGGGSSYLAVLAVSDVSFLVLPKIALICNLLVVSGGCWHYFKQGHFNQNLILPLVLSSVPMAFIGGMYPVTEKQFLVLLSVTLVMAGIRLLLMSRYQEGKIKTPLLWALVVVGIFLGFLSGIVALGGGIFLAPLLLNLKWARPKEAAAAASAFIFLNSASGLAGQLTKGLPTEVLEFWPLFLAVIIGGQIGSRVGTSKYVSQRLVQRGTAFLILIISSRLLYKLFI
jgi:uncharacterized protein